MDFNAVGIDWQGEGHGIVKFDPRLVVFFYTKSVMNYAASRDAGRPVHENKIYVRIHPPGERLNIVERPATDNDKKSYKPQWDSFLLNNTQVPEGSPIDYLFPNNPAVADTMKSNGIHTIEQLSQLSANAIDTMGMGAQQYVNLANEYLQKATDGSAFIKMKQDMEKKDQEVRILKDQLSKLAAQFEVMQRQYNNPNLGRMQPEFEPGYDAQTARINDTHVTNDLAKQKKTKKDASN